VTKDARIEVLDEWFVGVTAGDLLDLYEFLHDHNLPRARAAAKIGTPPVSTQEMNIWRKMILALDEEHYSNLSMRSSADAIFLVLKKYKGLEFSKDQGRQDFDPHHSDPLKSKCWRLLKARDRVPAARTIRDLLRRSEHRIRVGNKN